MHPVYSLPLISNDGSVYDIANALDNLNGIVNDMFQRLESRININLERTRDISKRVNVASEKVERLREMKKALTIYSPSKYPISDVDFIYKSLFDHDVYVHKNVSIPKTDIIKLGLTSDTNPQEKLHFYHVKVSDNSDERKKPHDLAIALESIENTAELLIFNTDESPYLMQGYNPGRSKAVTVVSKCDVSVVEGTAPVSILHREHSMRKESEEYSYAPGMGQAPELIMPADLPDLPGVADDVYFSNQPPSIECGVPATPPSPMLTDEEEKVSEVQTVITLPVLPDIDEPQSDAVVPPPPPPPPMPSSMPVGDVAIPSIKKPAERDSAPGPVESDAFSSLMEAIRQAGGVGKAKLKAATTNKTEQKAKAQSRSGGGDLMADLHAKLFMRRKGISGNRQLDGHSMLDRISSVIPEPQQQETSSNTERSSDDEDWD